MTLGNMLSVNGQAAQLDLEAFKDFAWAELREQPLFLPGICARPGCCCRFDQVRPWQVYCCTECRKIDEREFRNFGQKVAPALLAHQLGKYERTDSALRELSNAGRRYFSSAQSTFLTSRRDRMREMGVDYGCP